MPTHVTLLNLDEPINDDLVLALNPEWRQLKENFSDAQKQEIFFQALRYKYAKEKAAFKLWKAANWKVKRTLLAMAVCIGANPNRKLKLASPILLEASQAQDFHLTQYLLEKGANPNKGAAIGTVPLRLAKSIPLAELFISHGAKVPGDILVACCWPDYPVEMVQFYLDRHIQPVPGILSRGSLHCHKFAESSTQIEKVRKLLKAGTNVAIQGRIDRGTGLHEAAGQRNIVMCMAIIIHYIEQHKALLAYLKCLKNEFPYFYRNKDIRKFCFMEVSPLRQLRALLNIKNKRGETAYAILPIDELNPATCNYAKFATLGKGPQSDESATKKICVRIDETIEQEK